MTDPRKDDLINVDRAFQVAWIVYINGVEVPAVAAEIKYGVWNIPEAELALIPDPLLHRLGAEDRVSVQVFYCDYWMNPAQPQFRLMFDGEIVSWSYLNVQKNRSLSFNCVDYIQIWTQLFFFFMSSLNDIATGASGDQLGTTVTSVTSAGFAPTYPYSLFAQGLVPTGNAAASGDDSASAQTALIRRPIDFLYNVVRALIDVNIPNRTTPGSNFFSPWTRRTNFHKRFVALPYLEEGPNPGIFPILRAVQAEFAVNAVAQTASRVGTAGSIFQMIQEILQTLMMELCMLPTAPAVGGNYQTLNITGVAPDVSTPGQPVFLANYFTKPPFYFGLPPTCNVFFPSQIVNYAYEENYITQPTRMYFNEEALQGLLHADDNAPQALNTLMRDALSVAYPEEVDAAVRAARSDTSINAKDLLVYPEEFFKGPVVDRRPLPSWFMFLGHAGQQDPRANPTPAPVAEVPGSNTVPVAVPPAAAPGGSGRSTTITQADVTLAQQAGIPVEVMKAIRNVETGSGRPTSETVRFEPHVFNRITSNQYAARIPYTPCGQPQRPSVSLVRSETNRAAFERAKQFNYEAAVRASSWGKYQVLGATLYRIYPDDPVGAYDANPELVSDQVFVEYCRRRAVVRNAANRYDVMELARLYNGSTLWGERLTVELQRIRNAAPQAVSPVPVTPATQTAPRDPTSTAAGTPAAATTTATPSTTATAAASAAAAAAEATTGAAADAAKQDAAATAEATRAAATAQSTGATPGASVVDAISTEISAAVAAASGTETTTTSTDIVPGDSARDLFRLYAKYEFFKERYSRRTGTLQIAFNPYPVPGFPCAVFDRRSTQVDTFGYLMTVRQSLSANGWQTSLSFTHGRTFQEMFSLLQRQFTFENTLISSQQNDIVRQTGSTDSREQNATTVDPVGAVAIAPPEPLSEVRDVIQSFVRAEAFYRTLFYRQASVESQLLSSYQAQGQANRIPLPTPEPEPVLNDAQKAFEQNDAYARAAATAASTAPTAAQVANAPNLPPNMTIEGKDASRIPAQTSTEAAAQTATFNTPSAVPVNDILDTKRASFYYPDIIQFTDLNTDNTFDVSLYGIDSTARTQALEALTRLRANTSLSIDNDVFLVKQASQVPVVPTPYGQQHEALYRDIEMSIRGRVTASNVSGEYQITPRPTAIQLFDSYESAQQYNARPICTLEEYITFLGDRGVRISPINPDGARLANDTRLFPAVYYVQIKEMRDGPPAQIPTVNITNTATISGVDGTTATETPTETPATNTPAQGGTLSGLPDDFPETRANWTQLLLAYRQRALTSLPPRS